MNHEDPVPESEQQEREPGHDLAAPLEAIPCDEKIILSDLETEESWISSDRTLNLERCR